MVESSKQVRVDNWGIFFLQRLQMFFNKTDYCDLTLQFEGNVQLKVHRLVMNACTEYFQLLEQTCDVVDDNVIMMPADLQADVILPIVNFMYTGTLEFQMSIYDKLYKTAELMNIPVLIKLLEAQKTPVVTPRARKSANLSANSVASKNVNSGNAKTSGKVLPATLPGRKLPVWKRKNVPSQGYSVVSAVESKNKGDPLAGSGFDNAPKPTRFEWPEDDDLKPSFDFMVESTAFDSITYSSAPLIKQEDEMKSTPNTSSYDEIHYPNQPVTKATPSQSSHFNPPTPIIADYDEEDADDPDYRPTGSTSKRKQSSNTASSSSSAKKVRFNEKENKELKINAINAKGVQELDHSKIISEVLKKYPDLVKNNKNIKLKILTKPTGSSTITASAEKSPHKGQLQMMKIGPKTTTNSSKSSSVIRKAPISINVKSIKTGGQTTTTTTIVDQQSTGMMPPLVTKPSTKTLLDSANENTEGPWGCTKCTNPPDPYHLYYLFRKHMTDVHNEMFDALSCKYCGHRSSKNLRLLYHQYTVHGIAPSSGRIAVMFPRCDRCSFTGITEGALAKHRARHSRVDVQCEECKVGFNGNSALTAHMRITGHARKSGKSNYDCQYCTRRFQTGANLFTHLRKQHGDEARRDGIVSLDEMVDEDEEDEEEAGTTSGKDKVKILTDVKVLPGILRGARDNNNTAAAEQQHIEQIELEPSSEAESLSNVATGIATSLGLVDIVVLDDNQQYILQSNAGHDGHHQTEFILPELSSTTYVTNHHHHHLLSSSHTSVAGNAGNVGGGGGGNNSNAGAATTTDELVMVLTDHDYQDAVEGDENGAGGTSGDSSGNIVVLYSHPVGGEGSEGGGRGRYITTQGNLMMTADGMIEIRNSDGIVAASAADTSQHESIELIQQELNSGIVDSDKQQEMDTREIHLEEDEEEDEEQLIEEHLEEEHLDEEDLQEIHLECEENPPLAECGESKGEIEENVEAVGEIEEPQAEIDDNRVENEEDQVENEETQVGDDEKQSGGVNEESLVDNDEKLGSCEETGVESVEIQQETDENKEDTVDVGHEERQPETEGNLQEIEGNQLVNDDIQLDSHETSENQLKADKTLKIVDATAISDNEAQLSIKNATSNEEVIENVKNQQENVEVKENNEKCENTVEEIVEKSENLVEKIDENKSDVKKGDSAIDNELELVEKQGATMEEDKEDKSGEEKVDKDQQELPADVEEVDGTHLVEDEEIAKDKAEIEEIQQQDEAMDVDTDVDEVTTKINQTVNSSTETILQASSEITPPKAKEDQREVPTSLNDKPDIVILSQESEENEETTTSITDNKKTVDYEPEPMEVDGKVADKTEVTEVECLDLNVSKETDNMDDEEQEEVIGEIPHVTGDDTDKEDNSEKDEHLREKMVIKAQKFEEQLEKSRELTESKNDRVSKSVKNTISLLDDWEDTDSSQQSEKATISTNLITGRSNVSAVKKLINDWDDDE